MKKFLFLLFPFYLYSFSYIDSLDKIYIKDEFRVFYTLNGKNALPKNNQVDKNNNQIPDYVENITNQLSKVSKLLVDKYGFIHPLKQERFKGAKYIDIHLINLKVNGAAGDVVYKKQKALVIKLSINLIPNTLTPLHEFFHLVQYGYSMFNNRWSMEGQARWFEFLLKEGVGDFSKKLPKNLDELNILLNSIYEAKYFWNRLAYLVEPDKTKNIYAAFLIKEILEQYKIYSKKASEYYFYKPYTWTEKQQKSFNNNRFILLAIKQVLTKYSKIEEINSFNSLVDKYISMLELENSKNDYTKYIKVLSNTKKEFEKDNYKIEYLNNLLKDKTIKQYEIFPSKSIYHNKKKVIFRSVKYKDGFIYLAGYKLKNEVEPFGIYYGTIIENRLKAKEIVFNDNYKPLDISIFEDEVIVMLEDKTKEYKKIKLFLLNKNLDIEKLLFQFDTKYDLSGMMIEEGKYKFYNNETLLIKED